MSDCKRDPYCWAEDGHDGECGDVGYVVLEDERPRTYRSERLGRVTIPDRED